MNRRLLAICLIPIIVLTSRAAQYTVSKSMVGSSGSFTSAGFTLTPFTFQMSNSTVAGFSAPVPSNFTALANGGLTGNFCGSFIFVNTDTGIVVNLYLDSAATKTQAMVYPTHSVCIDGAPSKLWANAASIVGTNAVPTNNTAICSWAFADQ